MGRVLVCLAQGLSFAFKSTKIILEKNRRIFGSSVYGNKIRVHMRDSVKVTMRNQNGASHQKWPCGI